MVAVAGTAEDGDGLMLVMTICSHCSHVTHALHKINKIRLFFVHSVISLNIAAGCRKLGNNTSPVQSFVDHILLFRLEFGWIRCLI